MEHWFIAVVSPLSDVNPVRYLTDSAYRARSDNKHGRRARRIVIYQALLALAAAVLVAYFVRLGGGFG